MIWDFVCCLLFFVCCLGGLESLEGLDGLDINLRMCAQARQNARSDRVCLDFSLLRFFVSRQRNEEKRQIKEIEKFRI
jgi:hypothetical protein